MGTEHPNMDSLRDLLDRLADEKAEDLARDMAGNPPVHGNPYAYLLGALESRARMALWEHDRKAPA